MGENDPNANPNPDPGAEPDVPARPGGPGISGGPADRITEPGKLLRIVGMTQQVLDELRHDHLDLAARERVETSRIQSLDELRGLLPDESREELDRLTAPLESAGSPPTGMELRLAEAQLSGWLEGLLKGIEASQAAQQVDAQVQQARAGQGGTPRQDERSRHGYH